MKNSIYQLAFIIIIVLLNVKANAQADVLNHTRSTGQYVGWNAFNTGQAGALDIRSDINNSGTTYPIDFYINTSKLMSLTTAGDLNIVGASNGIKITNNIVLQTGGSLNDIFVGAGAGNGSMMGHNNTLMGRNAGSVITTGTSNTAIGHSAGKVISTATGTTFVGFEAGIANTTANDNTAIGYQALHSAATLGENVAVGYQALYTVSTFCQGCTGGLNTAVGYQALQNSDAYGGCAFGFHAAQLNITGCAIIAVGEEALLNNLGGNANIGVGEDALHQNTNLSCNVAIGTAALFGQSYTGTDSTFNVAVGYGSLNSNNPSSTSNGLKNTATGGYSLYMNATGSYNTAIGYKAGYNSAADSNVFVGYGADISTGGGGNFHNCAAYGYGATALGNGQFWFGNANIKGLYTVSAGLFVMSDGRFKINVQENVSGLDFIKRLRPVTYNLDAQAIDAFMNPGTTQQGDFSASTARVHSGFIAQEVEQAALASGFSSSIINLPENANDLYALNYAELVVPLVKAVKELDSINTSLQDQITALQSGNRIVSPPSQGQGSNERGTPDNSGSIELQNVKTLQLLDADPNPFSESTMIRWNIPNDFKDAMIYFYDNSGTQINSYKIDQKGSGELQVFGSKLSSGSYVYSLVVDSKLVDSKKLVKSK